MKRRVVILLTVIVFFAPHSTAHADVRQASTYSYRDWFCSYGQTWVNNEWGRPGL